MPINFITDQILLDVLRQVDPPKPGSVTPKTVPPTPVKSKQPPATTEVKSSNDHVDHKSTVTSTPKEKISRTSAAQTINPETVTTTTSSQLRYSTSLPDLPRGDLLAIRSDETLPQALEKYFWSHGLVDYRVSPGLVELVREMNQIPPDGALPNYITMWEPQAILAYRTVRDLPPDARIVRFGNNKEIVLTPKFVDESLSQARQLGEAVTTRAGDTWATFIDREYADLHLGADAKALFATMLQRLNHTRGDGDLPPVVMKPSLRGLARLNGEYRNQLPGVGLPVILDDQTLDMASQMGCNPKKTAEQPTAGHAYDGLPNESLIELTAFAYREQLGATSGRSPEDAESDLREMIRLMRELNGDRTAPLLFPSAERMAYLVAMRREERAVSAEDTTSGSSVPNATTREGRPWARHGDSSGAGAGAGAARFHERMQATLQRVTAMSTWTPSLSGSQQELATTEIANAIYKARRLDGAGFSPILGFAPVPFMGICWADIDAASMHREAMGGEQTRQFDTTSIGMSVVADMTPEERQTWLARFARFDRIIGELAGIMVDGRPLVEGGVLRLTRGPHEDFYKALCRVCGDKIPADDLRQLAEALRRLPSHTYEARACVQDLLGDAQGLAELETWYDDTINLEDLDKLLKEAKESHYVDVPNDTRGASVPYDQPERMEEYVLKALKRRNFDRRDLLPRQIEEVRRAAKNFVDQIHEAKRDATDFARRLNDRTVLLNRDLNRILSSHS